MAEDEITLHLPSGEFQMTRHNAHLFTFFGELATRNHIFLITEEHEDSMSGSYIFNWSPVFTQLAGFMAEYDYPMRLNQLEVPECDQNAFETALNQLEGKIDDSELEEWLDGEE